MEIFCDICRDDPQCPRVDGPVVGSSDQEGEEDDKTEEDLGCVCS